MLHYGIKSKQRWKKQVQVCSTVRMTQTAPVLIILSLIRLKEENRVLHYGIKSKQRWKKQVQVCSTVRMTERAMFEGEWEVKSAGERECLCV